MSKITIKGKIKGSRTFSYNQGQNEAVVLLITTEGDYPETFEINVFGDFGFDFTQKELIGRTVLAECFLKSRTKTVNDKTFYQLSLTAHAIMIGKLIIKVPSDYV